MIWRGDAASKSLPQAAKLPVQGHRAPGKRHSVPFSVVRAPGNLSSGQILARTGRQTPVDGAGKPEEQGTGMAADVFQSLPQRPKGAVQGKVAARRADGRGRSFGREHANQGYRRGNDLFRPRCANASLGLRQRPPDARRLARAYGPPEGNVINLATGRPTAFPHGEGGPPPGGSDEVL